jgi:hypothetical protein
MGGRLKILSEKRDSVLSEIRAVFVAQTNQPAAAMPPH